MSKIAPANPFYERRLRSQTATRQVENRCIQIGPATLYLGDCFDIMPMLRPMEAVVTDPPYGIGFKYRSYDDSPERYDGMMRRLVPQTDSACGRWAVFHVAESPQGRPVAQAFPAWLPDYCRLQALPAAPRQRPLPQLGSGSVLGATSARRVAA